MEATMHCPDCGSEALADQNFCRDCGLSLERVAKLLTELRSDTDDEIAALTRRRLRQLKKAGKIIGVTVGSVVWTYFTLAGILSINAGYVGMGLLFLGLGVGSIAAFLIGNYCTPLQKKTSTQESYQDVLATSESTNKIPHEAQTPFAMSVTDRTTARLEEKIKPRRLDE
jgi:hypothetical protein